MTKQKALEPDEIREIGDHVHEVGAASMILPMERVENRPNAELAEPYECEHCNSTHENLTLAARCAAAARAKAEKNIQVDQG